MSFMPFAVKKKVSYFKTKKDHPSFPFLLSFFPSLLNFTIVSFLFAEITTKFNWEFYAQVKEKKNEPLSNIGQHRLKVVEKEKEKKVTEKGSSTPALDEGLVSSSALSIEEITPHHKKHKTGEKGKKKVGANIWGDAETALTRANDLITPDELKEIAGIPSHEMVNRHVHKLVQVTFLCFPSPLVLLFLFNTKYHLFMI